jgi:DNA polymerase eta
MKLWKELHGTDPTRGAGGSDTTLKIINISLAFTGLDVMDHRQQGIEEFFKLGDEMLPPLPSRKRTRETFEATISHEAGAPRQAGSEQQQCPTVPEEIDGLSTRTLAWECPRCRLCLPIVVGPNEVESERVDIIRSEHEDWHFAKDLARENAVVLGGGGASKSTTRAPRLGKKKRKKESIDIASYFKKN